MYTLEQLNLLNRRFEQAVATGSLRQISDAALQLEAYRKAFQRQCEGHFPSTEDLKLQPLKTAI